MDAKIIDLTYFKITENNTGDPNDYYVIYPFDAFGNMYKRIQIDIDLAEDWNGTPIQIFIPEIETLNFQFDMKISITAYPTTGEAIPFYIPFVYAGNNNDAWTFDGAIYGEGSMVWTPQSFNPSPTFDPTYPYGSWCVVPQYTGGLGLQAQRTLDSAEAPSNFTPDWSKYIPKKKKR